VIVCILIDYIIAIIAGAAREEASEADAQQCLDSRERSVVRYTKRHHEQAQGKAKCKFGYANAKTRNADFPSFVLQEPEEINAVSFKRLALINKPEWKHGAVGVFASALLGLQMPGNMCSFLTFFFFDGHDDNNPDSHFACRLCPCTGGHHWRVLRTYCRCNPQRRIKVGWNLRSNWNWMLVGWNNSGDGLHLI
jgi:hypothetical protein